MAIFSFRMGDRISRGGGKSAVKVAAYQARENLQDARTGYAYNHRPKEHADQAPARGIAAASAHIGREAGYDERRKPALFVGLYAPSEAPDWCRGRENIEQFWSRAELGERRKDAHIAERFIIALPHELTLQQNVWLIQDYIKEAFVRQGRVVQVAIHAPEHGDERNVHAHLLVSTRGVDAQGFKATKTEEQHYRHLHRRQYVTDLRERWEAAANHHLQRHGHEARIDHRTLAEQGIEREATIHLGPGDSRRERQGIASAAGEINREIGERNAEREQQSLDQVHNQRHAEREAEVVDLDAWRRGLEQDAPEAAQTREAARVAAPAMSPTASGGRRRAQEATSEDDAAIRAIDAWRSGVEREWQGRGSPVKPVALDPEEEAQRARLEKTAWLDRKPGSRTALTVEDVARKLAPDYRGAMAEGQKQTGALAKAEAQVSGARKNRAIAEANIEDRQRQMPGWRHALHGIGWEDTELSKWQKQVKISEIVEERSLTHRTTARDALKFWERRADTALGTVRPAAEHELAQRQERAEKARAELAARGLWITDPPAVTDPVERQRLGAWQAFHLGEMRKAEKEREALRQVKKQAQARHLEQSAPAADPGVRREAAVQRVQARQDERQRVVRKTAAENTEEAAHSYWGGLVAKSKRRKQEQGQDQPLSHRQKHRQGYGQGL